MIKTMWTDAPSGFSALGGADVRSYACTRSVAGVVMAGTAAPFHGTGLPIARRLRGIDDFGAVRESALQPALAVSDLDSTTTDNNGTTLGIQSRGRPQS
ncbi:hypothetical protein [Blastococcus sp. TF02A-30]|uniref:hypothetical protein n=1 Tax=Blastococcus sp. TF02A-30 TaxID=2250580 RepID=UPI000DEBB01A|nr:hypothetical protein [Blastococcus sp. TF02A-30]RBY86496.1 hypothetical protein DQ241_13320 [Blastococcus sp. TF02A-30]